LVEYIKASRPKENLISVTTNGVLLDEGNIKELKTCGVDIFTVSLDSGLAQEHDSFRRMHGAFDKTLKGIKLALKNNINVTIGAVVSHQNIRSDGLKKLIELSKELKVILTLILAVPIGRWKNNRDILVTEQDMEYINELTLGSPYIRTDFDANYLYRGCGAAKEILYITPYGDVLTCPFIHISLGNIFEKSLKDLRNIALENKYFKNYWQKCLCGNDREFIDSFLNKVNESKQWPIEYRDVFYEKH
jgi:MoaA/NifB/PqqE/SkfB family radical SAM enzyme